MPPKMLTFSFCIIIVASFVLIFFDAFPISIRQTFFTFCFLFFGIAGLIQTQKGLEIAPLYAFLRDEDFIHTNIIIILSMLLYELLYVIFLRVINTKRNNTTTTIVYRNYSFVLYLLPVVLLFLKLNNFNIVNITIRGGTGAENSRMAVSQTIWLLTCSINFTFMSFCFFYNISSNRKKTISILTLLIFVFLCLPTSIPRLRILPLYLPIMAIFLPNTIKRKYFLSIAICIGTVLIFPLIGASRKDFDSFISFISLYDYDYITVFSSLDFDTYKSLVYVLSKKIITNGWQLLGCFLFWIPRSLWTSKPIGSGAFVSQQYDLGFGDFSNISMNYLAEGYINFGYIGLFLFVVFFAYISAWFDKAFWVLKKGNLKDPFSIYYFSTLGYVYFVLRGDLLSGTAYYCGMIAYIYLTDYLCIQRIKTPNTESNSSDLELIADNSSSHAEQS